MFSFTKLILTAAFFLQTSIVMTVIPNPETDLGFRVFLMCFPVNYLSDTVLLQYFIKLIQTCICVWNNQFILLPKWIPGQKKISSLLSSLQTGTEKTTKCLKTYGNKLRIREELITNFKSGKGHE